MGRYEKSYDTYITLIKLMKEGESLRFFVDHPWGLARKVYDYLENNNLNDQFNVQINKKSFEPNVVVEKRKSPENVRAKDLAEILRYKKETRHVED